MSISMRDAQIFSKVLKKARADKNLTQAECAELLNFSVSFQKDLERCRCSTSLEGFYRICRLLNISADEFIFPEQKQTSDSTYHELIRLISRCDESQLNVLIATANALLKSSSRSKETP